MSKRTPVGDVWFLFENPEDDEPIVEANTFYAYGDDDEYGYVIEYYSNAVGLVREVLAYSMEDAKNWYHNKGFEDYTPGR